MPNVNLGHIFVNGMRPRGYYIAAVIAKLRIEIVDGG